MGATITVRKYRLISLGETTRQGRVFCISDPSAGSKDTSQTSFKRGGSLTTASPPGRIHSQARRRAAVHRWWMARRRGTLLPSLREADGRVRSPDDRSRRAARRFLGGRIVRESAWGFGCLANYQCEPAQLSSETNTS